MATLPFDHLNAINSSAIIALGVVWLADTRWQFKISQINKHKIILAFVLLYLLHVAGVSYSNNKDEAGLVLERLLPLLAFPLILGTIPSFSEKNLQALLAIFVFSSLIATLICLSYASYQYFTTGITGYFFGEPFAGILENSAIYIAVHVGFCMFWLTDFLFKNKSILKNWQKAVLSLIIIYFFGILMLLIIRMAISVVMLFYIVGAVYYFFKKRQFIAGILAILLPLFIVGSIIVSNEKIRKKFKEAVYFEESIKVGDNKDYSLGKIWGGRALRVAIWQCAADVVKENFWWGVGTGDVQDELQKSYKKNNFLFASDYNVYNAHDQFLETQIALGLPGLITLIVCFLFPLIQAFRQQNYLHLAFLVFVIANCLTESFLVRQKGIVFFAVMSALFLFHTTKKELKSAR
jgi:O-antigen ligase